MPEFFRRVSSLSAASTSVDDSIARTIARMTRVPAQRFGIMRRGEIKKNYYADIAVWDKDSFVSKSTYDDPHQFAMGMKYVIVNGSVAFDNGVITSQGKGKLLTP
jgi:N-acyl-D-aspartate/D-glutamate deacylase